MSVFAEKIAWPRSRPARRCINFPATKACGLLDQFVPQDNPGKELTPIVSRKSMKSKGVRQIEKAFRKGIRKTNDYEQFCKLIMRRKKFRLLKYSSEDVKIFSLFCLRDFQGMQHFRLAAGNFLSALVNLSDEKDFTVHTDTLDCEIDGIGTDNCKNLTIIGSVGRYAFSGMISGNGVLRGNAADDLAQKASGGRLEIYGNCGNNAAEHAKADFELVVHGNTGHRTGASGGGHITVDGNAGNLPGVNAYGVSIKIKGDAGFEVGKEAGACKIYISGKIGSIGNPNSGPGCNREIYQNGVLVATGWNPFWQEFLAGNMENTYYAAQADPFGQIWLKSVEELNKKVYELFPGGYPELLETVNSIFKRK